MSEAIMDLTVVEAGGLTVVEGAPDQAFMASARDVDRVIEACFSARATSALLYAANLPGSFFDLSSGDAGAILQKLINYRLRLAVVCPPGSVDFSSRFGEMVAEERYGRHLGIFETRETAMEWIGRFIDEDAG